LFQNVPKSTKIYGFQDDEKRVVQCDITSLFKTMSSADLHLRYRPDYFEGTGTELYVANTLKWKHFGEEFKASWSQI